MKPLTYCLAGAAGLWVVSCETFKLGGDPSGGVKTDPYEDVNNGGYATGDFYGRDTNPYETGPVHTSDRYGQVYGTQGEHHSVEQYDRVNVIPFTDNGSSGYPDTGGRVARAPSQSSDLGSSRPKPAASTPRSSSKTSRRSADVVSAGRASSGSSSGRASKPRSTADDDPPARKSASSRKSTHVVRRGDTLYRISRTYGVPVETLKQRNQLDSDLIRVGEELVIR